MKSACARNFDYQPVVFSTHITIEVPVSGRNFPKRKISDIE